MPDKSLICKQSLIYVLWSKFLLRKTKASFFLQKWKHKISLYYLFYKFNFVPTYELLLMCFPFFFRSRNWFSATSIFLWSGQHGDCQSYGNGCWWAHSFGQGCSSTHAHITQQHRLKLLHVQHTNKVALSKVIKLFGTTNNIWCFVCVSEYTGETKNRNTKRNNVSP